MKESLKASLDYPNWFDKLPWTMLGIRSTPKDNLKTSSEELVYVPHANINTEANNDAYLE